MNSCGKYSETAAAKSVEETSVMDQTAEPMVESIKNMLKEECGGSESAENQYYPFTIGSGKEHYDISKFPDSVWKAILDRTFYKINSTDLYPTHSNEYPIDCEFVPDDEALNKLVLNRTKNTTPHEDLIPGLHNVDYIPHILRTLRNNFVYDVDKDFIDEIINTFIANGTFEHIILNHETCLTLATLYRNTSEYIYNNLGLGNYPISINSKMGPVLDDLMDTVMEGDPMPYERYQERIQRLESQPFEYKFNQSYYREN